MKQITINILIVAIVSTLIVILLLYSQQLYLAIIFFLVSALLWTVFAQELRLENCETKCGKK